MTTKRASDEDDTPILEWIAGAIGFALFAAAMVITVQNSLHEPTPPAFSVQAEPAAPVSGGFRVEFDITNLGDETAAQVVVRAELRTGDAVIEAHDVTIDFVAPRSTVHGGVFLKRDPKGLDLDVRASSFQSP